MEVQEEDLVVVVVEEEEKVEVVALEVALVADQVMEAVLELVEE